MDVISPMAVNPARAAKLMGISRSKLYELLNRGQLPWIKLGARSLVRIADIESFLATLANLPKVRREEAEE
jgi:excisionase family DNA binding protein